MCSALWLQALPLALLRDSVVIAIEAVEGCTLRALFGLVHYESTYFAKEMIDHIWQLSWHKLSRLNVH